MIAPTLPLPKEEVPRDIEVYSGCSAVPTMVNSAISRQSS